MVTNVIHKNGNGIYLELISINVIIDYNLVVFL